MMFTIIYFLGCIASLYSMYLANKYDNASLPLTYAILVSSFSWITVSAITIAFALSKINESNLSDKFKNPTKDS